MKLLITYLKTERHWRSATGLDQKRFDKLLLLFERAYLDLFSQSIEQRQDDCPEQPCLNTYTALLFFTLFSLKSGLTYDLLDLVTGMNGSSAKRNQDLGLAVLQETLSVSGYAPKRNFRSSEEFQSYFQKHKPLIVDATEQRTQRPQASAYQELMYSGKNNPIQSRP
ncbi:hypothetical protein EXU85_32580 [Spirosoma sp. KCTC 42546]|uniref:hypothetical protein n=1 Tax=Spirosoma sp. KCTC 42546 TaxID=2520506 RepID=UPI001157FBEF|nr:hypothetical protein [Spirosoma sp. KCTC 42546]QDK83084.1 hypothetical protein EXU85_32580 [Spirosoma sp. KCTC 42546]